VDAEAKMFIVLITEKRFLGFPHRLRLFGSSFESADSKPISNSRLTVAVRVVYAMFLIAFNFAQSRLPSKTAGV
jgi:hypothetical protein